MSSGKASICAKHIPAPRIGTKGTNGVLKGRIMSGCVLRSTIMDTQTIVNASSVPIETNSPNTLIGKRPAMIPVEMQVTTVALCGVLYALCTFEKNFGSNPSLDIE